MQYKCDQCGVKLFYVMLQDDGSIDVFCSTGNHKKTLCNVTELVTSVLNAQESREHEVTGSDATNTGLCDKCGCDHDIVGTCESSIRK